MLAREQEVGSADDPLQLTLPQPYLLFLGDTVEPGYAKTAFGLRDWARRALRRRVRVCRARRSRTGLPKLTPERGARQGRAGAGHRRRQLRRVHRGELGAGAGRGARSRAATSSAECTRGSNDVPEIRAAAERARPAADRRARTAREHPDRDRAEAQRQAAAHRRHRLRAGQEIHRAGDRASLRRSAASTPTSAPPARPGS